MSADVREVASKIRSSSHWRLGVNLTRELGRNLGMPWIGMIDDVTAAEQIIMPDGNPLNKLLGGHTPAIESWYGSNCLSRHSGMMRCKTEQFPFVLTTQCEYSASDPGSLQRRLLGEMLDHHIRCTLFVPIHMECGRTAAMVWNSDEVRQTKGVLKDQWQELFVFGHAFTSLLRKTDKLAPSAALLTERQRTALLWAARGKTSGETATILGLSPHTVREHLTHAITRLDAANIAHAVSKAWHKGLLS